MAKTIYFVERYGAHHDSQASPYLNKGILNPRGVPNINIIAEDLRKDLSDRLGQEPEVPLFYHTDPVGTETAALIFDALGGQVKLVPRGGHRSFGNEKLLELINGLADTAIIVDHRWTVRRAVEK